MAALRIGIASIGRFHMFDLARQMARLGQAPTLYTGYPRWKVEADLRPYSRTRSAWVVAESVRRTLGRYSSEAFTWWSNRVLDDFGAWLARSIGDVEILDALAGTGWETGRVLARRGVPWICNRGSTHILSQIELLQEEHARWGAPPLHVDHGRPMARCLEEYAEADALVVPSDFARQSFLDRGFAKDRVYVCPYGVDLSLFRPRPREDARFRVVFVGAYSIRKGLGYLLEAVRPLVQAGRIEVWLVGSPSDDARPLLAANRDVFRDMGRHPRRDLAWFYSQASVLVLPSIEEGLALVLAQAMACGVPVIATPNTGAEDLLADGVEGFIVRARDAVGIRHRIERLLDRPDERAAMAAAAVRRVTTLQGWNEYGRRCLDIYREVIERKRTRA